MLNIDIQYNSNLLNRLMLFLFRNFNVMNHKSTIKHKTKVLICGGHFVTFTLRTFWRNNQEIKFMKQSIPTIEI